MDSISPRTHQDMTKLTLTAVKYHERGTCLVHVDVFKAKPSESGSKLMAEVS